MVRLVFRPYVQVWRTICTSVSLRASTRVSSGFTLLRYSSPSFGSQRTRSHSNLSPRVQAGRLGKNISCCFHCAYGDKRYILAHAYGLLGPCFKTGHFKPLRSTPPATRALHLLLVDTMQTYCYIIYKKHQTRVAATRAKGFPPWSAPRYTHREQHRRDHHSTKTRVDEIIRFGLQSRFS